MPGISVHHSGQSYGRRLVVNTMLKRQLARPVFPVHRLDHRTSGALLFAFTSGDAARLQKALSEGEKTYVAFVRGEWKLAPKLRLDLPVKVSGVEKSAVTNFELLATQGGGGGTPASVVICRPETGRTHQIRRHLKHLSYPIIGDSEHGDSKVNRWWREERGFDRLGLHALELKLPGDEVDGNGVDVVAPLRSEEWEGLEGEEVWIEALGKDERLGREFVDERGGSFGRRYKERKGGEGET